MKKYIFILANGAGMQTALYFSGFHKPDTDSENIKLSDTASGAMVLEGTNEARETSEKIMRINPSYSIIWCPIESRTIDILS